jgi:hypothetical protein
VLGDVHHALFTVPEQMPPRGVASLTMLFAGLGAASVALPGIFRTNWGTIGGAWVAFAYSSVFVAAFGLWARQQGISKVRETCPHQVR